MPEGTKVARCVHKLVAKGYAKPNAIRICQKSTGLSYQTGKPAKGKKRLRKRKKH